jgi:hypothetical protein
VLFRSLHLKVIRDIIDDSLGDSTKRQGQKKYESVFIR